MKQVFVILFALLLGSQQSYAQTSEKLESFRANVLPQYSMYFIQAELTENGQLKLFAVDRYSGLSADGKNAIMANIASVWRESLVLVYYGTERELWGWSVETGDTQLLDEWNLNAPQLPKAMKIVSSNHPWFFYIGSLFSGDSQKNINLSLNTRLGFFLLLNRWDLATTLSAGLSGNADATPSGWSNIGLMSRVHFPIKKYRISPNIGGEITVASFGTAPSDVNASLVLGISWFVGIGSLNIGVKIGNISTGMGGYTMGPRIKNNK